MHPGPFSFLPSYDSTTNILLCRIHNTLACLTLRCRLRCCSRYYFSGQNFFCYRGSVCQCSMYVSVVGARFAALTLKLASIETLSFRIRRVVIKKGKSLCILSNKPFRMRRRRRSCSISSLQTSKTSKGKTLRGRDSSFVVVAFLIGSE